MVANVDISRLQHIDRPSVLGAYAPILFTLLLDHFLDIRTARHPLRRERATHQYLVGMNAVPPILVFVIESSGPQLRPRLFKRDRFHSFQDVVRNLRAAIRETLPLPVRRVLHHHFASQESRLLSESRSGSEQNSKVDRQSVHRYPLLTGSNQGVPGT